MNANTREEKNIQEWNTEEDRVGSWTEASAAGGRNRCVENSVKRIEK